MILAIDIGNTNISFALFKGSKISRHWDIPAKTYAKSRLSADIRAKNINSAFICSVVPGLTKKLSADIKNITGIRPAIIGKDILVPMKNLYRYPRQLGLDRLVNAYAASRIYSPPVIVLSSGTALTIDAVSKNKAYLGGFILPGLNPSLSALNANTALLPKLKLIPVSRHIGKDTRSSMLNGVILGTAAAADALIKRIRFKIGKEARIIGTGGDIDLIKRFSKYIIKVDKELTLKGIFLLSQKNAGADADKEEIPNSRKKS